MRLKLLLKTTVLTALLLIAGKVGWGQVLLGENFDYTVGTTVTSAGWVDQGAPPTLTNLITVTAGNLSFLNYYSSGVGNQISLLTSGQDIFKGFTSQTSGSVYTSFLVNISAANTIGDYFFALKSVPLGSDFTLVGRLFVKKDVSNALAFGISKTSTTAATISYTTFTYALNTTYLLVVKYTMVAGPTNDNVQLFIDPVVGAAEPGASTLTYIDVANADATAMAAVCLRQGTAANAATLTVDGLRVATTWAAAVKINTAAPIAIFTPANLATGVDPNANIVIGFDAPIVNTDGSAIVDPTSLITLKETDGVGADVAFTATINTAKNQITIDPTAKLKTAQLYYVGVAAVKDNYANVSALQTATFTTRAVGTTATVTSSTYTVSAVSPWTVKLVPANVSVATFESKITSVTGSTFATYTDATCTVLATGNVVSGNTLKVISEDGTTATTLYTLVVTPVLTADTDLNDVDHSIVITYSDATWFAAAGTVVKDGATTLTVTTDYTLADGILTLLPKATNTLKTPGSRTITVTKTGYADATVTQVITAGAPTAANSTISNSAALNLGTTSTVTLTAKDQFSNLVSGYTFKYDVSVTNTDATTAEVYTVDGSTAATATDVSVVTPTNVSGVATFPIVMPAIVDGGDGISLQVQLNDGTTNLGSAISYVGAPALTADGTNNDVDHNIVITFTELAAWRPLITAVKDGATTLVLNTDYTVAAGELTLIPLATNTLKVSGSRTITVIATGYPNSTVTQVINPGVPTVANSTISNTPALGLNTTSVVTLTAKDQFSNLVSGYVFKYDAALTTLDAATIESYNINGTATTANASDIDLTATNASGVSTFSIVTRAIIDGGDGISVQVQLSNGTANLGSAISYIAPLVPAVAATATLVESSLNTATINIQILNETFKDATLATGSFTLLNAPDGLTVSGVTYLTDKTATVTLAYTPTIDFDVNITNLKVVVDGSEFTLVGTGTLTSNNLTITATVETPVVTTNPAITTNGIITATWGGDVTADGGQAVTQKGICWNTTGTPVIGDSKTTEGAGIGAITGSMTSLLPSTLYHVRAYASNSDLTAYGSEFTFTTNDPTLTLGALGATSYYSGVVVDLTWTSVGVNNVKIELWDGAAYSTLLASTPADGAESVTIPTTSASGVAYKIKISDVANSAVVSESAAFTVIHLTSIYDIQYTANASGDSPYAGQTVTTSGIVTGINLTGAGSTQVAFFIQDGTGTYSALYVYTSMAPAVAIGDKVIVKGPVSEYNKLTELSPTVANGGSVTIVNHGNALPPVVALTTLAANGEGYESMLIKVTNANCASGASGTYQVTDGSGNVQVYKGLFATLALTVNNVYSITGFLSQFTAYQLLPRSASDIVNSTATVTSTVYTVGTTDITNVPFNATYAEFIANIAFPSGSTHAYYLSDGTTPTTTMTTGNILSVTSQDGLTTKTYSIVLNAPRTGSDILTYGIGTYTGTIADPNISVVVAFSDNLASLIATFTLSPGATATISSVDQVSGTTANNFTSAVTYVVKAEDGSTKNWTVTVTKAATALTGKDILTYTIAGINATVTVATHTVTATVPSNTVLTNLVATFTLSPLATAKIATTPQVSGTTANDFTNAVVYTITAEDLSTQTWTVTVTKAAASTADLFFSEYTEGPTGNNKAFEIYNPTSTAVDLSAYSVKASNNGAGFGIWAGPNGLPPYTGGVADTRYVLTFPVGTMIAPGDVYVVYNSAAVAAITSVGDKGLTFSTTVNDPTNLGANVAGFNGNDALGLFKGTTLIDVFGIEHVVATSSFDPAFDVAGTSAAAMDHSMIRKPAVHAGNTNWATAAGTDAASSEWIILGVDVFTNLGMHTMDPITSGPTITASTATLASFGGVQINTTSGEKPFTVSGTNLTGNIVITAPAGFEISKTSGVTFSSESPITLTRTLGNVAETAIYVRFAPTVDQAYSDNITITSTGATDKTVAVSGFAIAPSVTVSVASLTSFGNVNINTTSAIQRDFTVIGSNLTANLVITAPTGFLISKLSGGSFTNESSISLTPTAAQTLTTIYVAFHPTSVQSYTGNITVASTGVTTKNVAVSGAGLSTGINDNWDSNLKIYPNPFTNEIRFEGAQNVKRVMVTSVTGQVLRDVVIGESNSVSTQDLPLGMYFVTFMNDKGEKAIHKMIKQ